MKSLTVRLPEALVADIEAESRVRRVSKSDVIRERLEEGPRRAGSNAASWEAVADVVGSVGGLPADLSRRKKVYLDETGYGQKRNR
jgi:Arc/MetJ-type ribon-helix-helix transcriptional regulator